MTIAYRSGSTAGNASGGNLTITKPTGTANGDLLVVALYREAGTWTLPSGWTQWGSDFRDYGSDQMYLTVAYKVAGASEPSSYTFNLSTSTWRIAAMGCWTGSFGSNPLDAGPVGNALNTFSAPVAASITTGVANTVALALHGNYNGSDVLVGSSGYAAGPGLGGCEIWYLAYPSAGATGDKTFSFSPSTGGGDWSCVHLSIKESSGAVSVSGAGAIASGEAFGTPIISVAASPSGVVSNEAHGAQSIQASLTNISGIVSVESLGTPAVGGIVASTGIPSGEAFGIPALRINITNISAIASSEAIGSPSLQAGIESAGGIASAEASGTPDILPAIVPAGISSQEALGTAALSVNVAGAGDIATSETFGTANVSGMAPVDITDAGAIASGEAFGTPSISAVLAPVGAISQEAIGTSLVSVALAGAGNIAGAEAFGTANVSTTAPVDLTDAGNIASIEAFGTPVITLAVIPASIGSNEVIGDPALSVDLIGAGNIASTEAFGTLTVSTVSPINLTGVGAISSAEAFDLPTLLVQIFPAEVASSELFGVPTFVVDIAASGIASDEAFGSAVVGDAVPVYEPVLKSRGRDQVVGVKTRNLR